MTELRGYEQETGQLEEELHKIPADVEAEKLLSNLAEVQTRIVTLLAQAEQGRTTLEGARGHQEQRGHDIHAYKQFLDETDAWLKNIVASMKEQQPIATNKVRRTFFHRAPLSRSSNDTRLISKTNENETIDENKNILVKKKRNG